MNVHHCQNTNVKRGLQDQTQIKVPKEVISALLLNAIDKLWTESLQELQRLVYYDNWYDWEYVRQEKPALRDEILRVISHTFKLRTVGLLIFVKVVQRHYLILDVEHLEISQRVYLTVDCIGDSWELNFQDWKVDSKLQGIDHWP